MPSADNAKVQVEGGQTLNAYAAMTDSGDHEVFTVSGGTLWSGKSGYTPSVRPNGISSGSQVLSTHADDDKVTIAAFKAYSKGVEQTVTATTTTITRASTDAKAQVHSIVMQSDGSIAVVEGTIGTGTSFSETRDAAGGPPLIPKNDVEIGQVRVSASASAALTSAEIFQTVGTHAEYYNYPLWTENNVGDGEYASVAAKQNAYIEFGSALPLIHTDTSACAKKVYIQYYEPELSDVERAWNFTPPENTHSISSQQVYGGTVGSVSSSLGAGGFSCMLNDGVSDTLIREKDEILTFKFFPDRDKTAYILCQGKNGVARQYPPDGQIQATVSIGAEVPAAEFTS